MILRYANQGINELQARDSCSPEEAAEHGIAGGDARLLARLSLSLFSSLVCHHMFEEISLIRLRGTAPICCLMFEELERAREAWHHRQFSKFAAALRRRRRRRLHHMGFFHLSDDGGRGTDRPGHRSLEAILGEVTPCTKEINTIAALYDVRRFQNYYMWQP